MQEKDLQELYGCIIGSDSEKIQKISEDLVVNYRPTEVLKCAIDKDSNGEFKVAYYLANATIDKLENDNDNAAAHYIAGKTAEKLGYEDEKKIHFEKARILYESYIKIKEADETAYYNYAMLLEKMGLEDEAKKNYKMAIDKNPKYAKAHNNYAILLAKQKDYCSAKKHYQKAIELDPSNFNAHNNYANLLNEMGHKFEAEIHFKEAIKIEPKYFAAHHNYAYLLKDLNRLYEAEEQAKFALELKPNDPLGLSALGAILMDKGDLNEAEIALKEALENSKSIYTKRNELLESRIRTYLGLVYAKEKRPRDAEREYKEALRLNKGNESAKINLAFLREEKAVPKTTNGQIIISLILLIPLGLDYYLLIYGHISESIFAAQSTIMIGLAIMILFIQHIHHFEVGSQGIKFDFKEPEPTPIDSRLQIH